MSNGTCSTARSPRARAVAAAVSALCAASFAAPLHADDGGSSGKSPGAAAAQDGQDTLQMLKQLQALQTANGEQQIMQDGFSVGETVLTATGQPEFAAGLKLLEGVLDFMGVFGSSPSSSSAQSAALAKLTRALGNAQAQLQYLQVATDKLNVDLAGLTNETHAGKIHDMQAALGGLQDQLYPNSHVLNPSGAGPSPLSAGSVPLRPGATGAGGGANSEPVDRATAGTIASQIAGQLDLFIVNESQYFIGDDIQKVPAVYGPKDPTSPANTPPPLVSPAHLVAAPGLKPDPALTTYIFGLQLWMTAMEIESGGTASGYAGIKQDSKTQAWVRKHVAFLSSKAHAGSDPNTPSASVCGVSPSKAPVPEACAGTIQDRIVHAVSCQWNVHGGAVGSNYPDRQGTCSATLSCKDDIARNYPKIPPVSVSWNQQDRNSLCTFDPSAQMLTGGVGFNGKPLTNPLPFPSDLARQVENALQQQYGLMAMDRMAAMLQQVALTGTALGFGAPQSACNGCSFGTAGDAPFFVYAVDGSGNVKNYAGFRNQPLPKASSAGTIANIRSLIPGGDKTFYAVTQDGKLNWYQFTPGRQSAAAAVQPTANTVSGPITVASSFGAYKQVFGGSDGVIYAIQNDGTLLWFRHGGFANGGGANTMTGPKTVASGFGQFRSVFSAGDGIIYAVGSDGTLFWYRHKNYLTGVADAPGPSNMTSAKVVANKVDKNPAVASQLEGPVAVGTGWGGFQQLVPSGKGVVLALQGDGKLLWYRHDDYLTGVSTGPAPGTNASSSTVEKNAAYPIGWGSTSTTATGAAAAAQPNHGAIESSWGSVKTAQVQPASGPSQPGMPAHTVMGTTGSLPSSLHGGTDPATAHTGTSPSGIGNTGIAGRPNVGGAAYLGAGGGTPHWEGPFTVDAQSGWQGFPEIAAILPVTVQTNVIK